MTASDKPPAAGAEVNVWGLHQYGGLRGRIERFIETEGFRNAILGVILLNAICLGLDSDPAIHAQFAGILDAIDRVVIAVFVVELAMKLFVERRAFFSSGWNLFDLFVVVISLLPNAGVFSVLRILRVFRVFRLFSVVPALRRVVDALFKAIPGIGAILAVMALLFYAAAVMSVEMFGRDFASQFGSVPIAILSLFQLMTLDGWSSEIVRPVMEKHPWSWVFFITFILLTSFTVLNLFIAVIVEALQNEAVVKVEDVKEQLEGEITETREELTEELQEAQEELSEDIHAVERQAELARLKAEADKTEILAAIAALKDELVTIRGRG